MALNLFLLAVSLLLLQFLASDGLLLWSLSSRVINCDIFLKSLSAVNKSNNTCFAIVEVRERRLGYFYVFMYSLQSVCTILLQLVLIFSDLLGLVATVSALLSTFHILLFFL